MDTAALFPVGTNTSSHGIPGLDANSYTAHKLKHATPQHLHLTTRRFFIGPIPEGWLSSNRKSWYKRRLELSSYSSRAATFHAAEGQGQHHRTVSGLDRSVAARMSFSFPQPEDIEESASDKEIPDGSQTEDEDDYDDTTEIEPVSTVDQPALPRTADEPHEEQPADEVIPRSKSAAHTLDGGSLGSRSDERYLTPQSSRRDDVNGIDIQATPYDVDGTARYSSEAGPGPSSLLRSSASATRDSSFQHNGLDVRQGSIEAGSRTALLASTMSNNKPPPSRSGQKSLSNHEPRPDTGQAKEPHISGERAVGVRFRVGDAVADGGRRVGKRADRARNRVERTIGRRKTLRKGTIVKMEKMLVRVDTTVQQVPDDYDENNSMKMSTKIMEKWQEFIVVARQSSEDDEDDFRLQFYKTRVIPEIDDNSNSKKPTREIKLIKNSTHVNLFSSLDKSLVVWHPYRKGTRITVMKCESAANSVEWYSFLRDALGWKRPDKLQVFVPDLDVQLQIEKPFEEMVKASLEAQDEETAMAKVEAAEQAVAGKIIGQCIDILKGNPEWTSVVHHWSGTSKPGLAWKRYDRLEWIHGVHEQKMYGSVAMQHSYELELRPKMHYPQNATGHKGKEHEEPAPVEGFLIRMTSQKGIHKRMGKTFFKRLYFSTFDNLLVFCRPAQATPPHPPRLQTISGSNIPSAQEIVEKTPTTYEINPYPLNDSGEVRWLSSGLQGRIVRNDLEAFEEARRNHANLNSSDGYINMTHIRIVRKMHWGTDSVDETLESGSDVDFHESVTDTTRFDGQTSQIDNDRIFELILSNGLVIRLQAYDKSTRDEWIIRLKALVKYWKLRKEGDMNTFKQIRASNLATLQIDEDVEAELGQFGHKWEVTRSEASPQLYNICSISNCRTISLSGQLYRKARRHGTFQRCGVVLTGGKILIYQSTLRKMSGAQVANIHQDKQQVIDLQGCYVYSGLIVEDDLLYQNRTFDANHMGTMAALPRVWADDGWTSTDVDVMCCFVVWMNTRKGWFRTAGNTMFDGRDSSNAGDERTDVKNGPSKSRAKLKRVRQLGVPGRGMVFKCRSRAERDLWVLNLNIEIERLVERQKWEAEAEGGEVRFAD